MTKEVKLRCFTPDLINPTEKNYMTDTGGSKIVIVGKANTGKSTLIKYLVHVKRNIIPTAVVISGTEDSNRFYSSMFPDLFIHNEYSESVIRNVIQRQKLSITHLEPEARYTLLILDDCTDDKKIFTSTIQHSLFKNGRHWRLFYILSLQHATDIPPAIRTNVDGVFIFKETNENNLHNIYNNYAGIIPSFSIFKQVMNQITGDYTALFIDNMTQDNNNWENNVYWFKAPLIKNEKEFGCEEYKEYGRTRIFKS
ncbi:hypothetical protein AGMMS49579_22120 [Spirochaetia bacterium]|nr:hypothetical protein AGMMS49579_22120 [Spirochaetia bacterium]